MKRVGYFIVVFCVFLMAGNAQIPVKFNYQAVIHDNTGELVLNQNIAVKVSILDGTPTGEDLYSETHSVKSDAYGVVNFKVGTGNNVVGDLSTLDWVGSSKFLQVDVDLSNGTNYITVGVSEIVSVPYAIYANSAENLRDDGVYSTNTDTLFVVKDHSGNVVFAVFPDGAEIIVNETAKGKVGGFAVSGRSPTKAIDTEYLRVTTDSTRIYVDEPIVKGKVGGFAISGRSPTKGVVNDYLVVTNDSTRIYVNENTGVKGKVGGFAVSGRSPTKVGYNPIFLSNSDSTRIFVQDSVAGFGVANIESGTAENFLNLNKQNYLIGHQTGSNTTGTYNSMIGYQAGFTNSSGSNNLFLGYKAGYSNVTGGNNVFIGTESGYVNQFTFQNTYVGYRSGYDLSGAGNTVMGSMAGENAGGGNNTFIGTSAGRIATGGNNTFLGNGAGYGFPTENTGIRNTYIGQASGAKTTTGSYNVMLGFDAGYLNYEGSRNTFLGYDAGHNIHEGSGNVFIGHEAGKSQDGVSDKLFISNWDDLTPLIYGDFNLDRLSFNGNVGINRNPYSSVSLSVSPAGRAYGIYVDAGSTIYAAYFNGSIYTTGTYQPSDEKFKKNIIPVNHALRELSELSVIYYNWKTEEFPERKFTGRKQIGFLAQEVEKSFPELVEEDSEGNKAINYSKFTPILVEAIKEQQDQIETLKDENELLKSKLEEILLRLNEIEK